MSRTPSNEPVCRASARLAVHRPARRPRAALERLESRCLMTTPGVNLTPLPNWTPQGPAPITFDPAGNLANQEGALDAVAVKPRNSRSWKTSLSTPTRSSLAASTEASG